MIASTFPPTDCSIERSHCNYELPADEWHDLLSSTPIDRQHLLEQCLSNLDFARVLLNEFEKTSQSRLDAFTAAFADGNFAAITRKAHALKGVAGILAAHALMETCSNLEAAALDTDRDRTHALIQQLHFEVARILDFIPNIQSLA